MLRTSLSLKSPFLKKLSFDRSKADDEDSYPFTVPIFKKNFSLNFSNPVTIFTGENGTGKSTLLEFIAHACGFNIWGGSKNHVYSANENQSLSYLKSLNNTINLSWLPKVSKGFFMRAETFFNFMEHVHYNIDFHPNCYGGDLFQRSHGESFLSFFEHQLNRKGIFLFDEPESALSPSRQIEFLKLLNKVKKSQSGQIIMITHSPLLMAFPGAELVSFSRCGLEPIRLQETLHFQLMERFFNDPEKFLDEKL